MRAVCASLFAVALLSGCSQQRPDYTPQAGIVILDTPMKLAENRAAKGCRDAESDAECEARRIAAFNAVTARQSPPDDVMQRKEAADLRADADRRAHADCVYQAQMANVMSPGLLNGFLNGISAGAVCQNYYRNIGVMR